MVEYTLLLHLIPYEDTDIACTRNVQYQRWLYIDTQTGRTQWEPPEQGPTAPIDQIQEQQGQPAAQGHSKRRQYAADQAQAYYGGAEPQSELPYGGLQPPPPGPQSQGQLFTPGLASEGQFQNQQQQQPQQPSYYQPQNAYSSPGPAYGQPQPAGGVDALANQFGTMGLGGQKPLSLYTTNLLTSPPDPNELLRPPPEIRLPPNSAMTPSPFANADPSYQRSTLNAIPTTSSLLGKSKIPLGLIITPYRTVKEGEPQVPVITDTVIARCRRCRTYINPYVQFIDGGNRYVIFSTHHTAYSYLYLTPLAGDAACALCRTKFLNYSTGIRPRISPEIAGRVQN
jgi:protein transport protein SEC24